MSVLSPRLQIVNGLPGSPKAEAKGALLVGVLRTRLPVPLGCRLMLIGLSPSPVGSRAGSSLSAYIPTLCCISCWFIHAGKAWGGRLVKWVEKSSIEKIRRLLEIFERELHCEVLLTLENIYAVIRNPAPYTLLAIPRPLPSNVVEGEHFVIADLRHLASGSASASRDPVVEASSRA